MQPMKTAASSTSARIVSFAAILLLLLQVQMVFACAMPELPPAAAAMAEGHKVGCDCCTEDLAATLLKADCRDQQAVLQQTKFAPKLPQLAALPSPEWPLIPALPTTVPVDNSLFDSASPGNRTWLATLRLRI